MRAATLGLLLSAVSFVSAAAHEGSTVVGCFVVGPFEVGLPIDWFAGRHPSDSGVDAYLISPDTEQGDEIQIIVTSDPEAGALDAFALSRKRTLQQSSRLKERILKERRLAASASRPAIVEMVTEAAGGTRFLSWLTVVDGKGYEFAGRAPSKSFARYETKLKAVLETLTTTLSGKSCAQPLVYTEIPGEQQIGGTVHADHMWLQQKALDEKLDFESEARRGSVDGVCDVRVKPVYDPHRNAPSRVLLTAACGRGAPISRSVSNSPR